MPALHPTYIYVKLLAVIVLQSVLTGAGGEPDCFNLIQSLHTFEFDKQSTEENISHLLLEIDKHRNEENSDESELSEQSSALQKISQQLQEASVSAKILQDNLVNAQNKTSMEYINLTETRRKIHALDERLRSVKLDIESLFLGQENMDHLRHKDELKVQMLKNDLSAADQVLHDSEQLLGKQTSRLKNLKARLQLVSGNETVAIKKLQSTRGEYQLIESLVERLKRERLDAQTILINAQHDRDEISQIVEHSKQAIEGDAIEASAANRTLLMFETDVLSGIKRHIQELHFEKLNVTKLLNDTQDTIASLKHINTSVGTKPVRTDSISPKSLRDTLRESRMFLAKQGYKDQISLLQSIAAENLGTDVDTDLRLFRETSKQLALQKRLQDIDSDALSVEGELEQSKEKEKELQDRLNILVAKEDADKQSFHLELPKLNKSEHELVTIERHGSSLESELSKRIAEEQRQKAIVDANDKEAEILSEKAKALSRTLKSTFAAVAEATRDRESHLNDVKHIRDDMNSTVAEIYTLDSNLTIISNKLKSQQESLTQINERLAELTKSADDGERLHTEYMADVAQLGRRIEEKADVITELESSKKSRQSAVEKLESQIRERLNTLEELNRKFKEETQVRNTFNRKILQIKNDLKRMQCKI